MDVDNNLVPHLITRILGRVWTKFWLRLIGNNDPLVAAFEIFYRTAFAAN